MRFLKALGFVPLGAQYLEYRTPVGVVVIGRSSLTASHARLTLFAILTVLFPRWAARHPWRGAAVFPNP